jgi:hypothetical protein
MLGQIGPVELLIILAMAAFVLLLLPLAAVVVIARMAVTGRIGGPKHCPHCGADLRAPAKGRDPSA